MGPCGWAGPSGCAAPRPHHPGWSIEAPGGTGDGLKSSWRAVTGPMDWVGESTGAEAARTAVDGPGVTGQRRGGSDPAWRGSPE
jgi:hypothetical protein